MNRDEIIKQNKISEIVELTLNGYVQKVLIEGRHENLPIVVVLHGGPGTPIPFSVGCRGLYKELTDKYIMVYWDQLGCGINNCILDDNFKVNDYVLMAKDLINFIKIKFPKNKIAIYGISWGSLLTAKLLEKEPTIVDGVSICGQIINQSDFLIDIIEMINSSNAPIEIKNYIKNLKVGNTKKDDVNYVFEALKQYTNGYKNSNGQGIDMGYVLRGISSSPDYSESDFNAIFENGFTHNNSLMADTLTLDVTHILNNVKIPYVIFQGDTDVVTPTRKVVELVKNSKNENLKCYVIKDTGHIPGVTMMDKLFESIDEIFNK